MKKKLGFALTAFALLMPGLSVAQELTKEQMEPWEALEKQVAYAVGKEHEKEKEFIHDKAIWGGDDLPSPATAARVDDYYRTFWDAQGDVESHVLIPVTVTVVDNVAIINAFLKVLLKSEGEFNEITFRLHNTWIKEEGRWKLLSTYNGQVDASLRTK